ncbi:hypothetical protein V6N11_008008 [Hibiscus sabdariffa]|uniref:RNase H type-1 domain-containing protein n=1 Tax=Hibiscus sabdariffa TaxID=183260 RepID=A0ABR2PZC9_9ROSI
MQPPFSIAQQGLTWARYYNDSKYSPPTRQLQHATPNNWSRPGLGQVCLNVDGAVNLGTDIGSIRGLIRDNEGNWIMGFKQILGSTSIFNAELWTIYTGLKLAWDNSFERIILQLDCLEAVTTIHESNAEYNPNSLVRAIKNFSRKCWDMEIQ